MFNVVLIKEISKVYESVIKMKIVDMGQYLETEKKIRGEFVLIINRQ